MCGDPTAAIRKLRQIRAELRQLAAFIRGRA